MLEYYAHLPEALREASIVARYNKATGAHMTHMELRTLGILDRDDVELIVRYGDLVY